MAYPASKILTIYYVLIVFSILTTFGIAVGLGHTKPYVPYLGFIGDLPPESTVFTQLFVIVAAAFMLVVQIQYVNTSHLVEREDAPVVYVRVNVASVCAGYGASIGLFVLACFQECHAYVVHHFAEFVYLFFSFLYFAFHTLISKKRRDVRTGVRIVLLGLMAASLLAFVIGYWMAVKMLEKPWEERYFWENEDKGWLPYIISATSEWVLIALYQCYLFTFYSDFYYIMLLKTSIVVLNNEHFSNQEGYH